MGILYKMVAVPDYPGQKKTCIRGLKSHASWVRAFCSNRVDYPVREATCRSPGSKSIYTSFFHTGSCSPCEIL